MANRASLATAAADAITARKPGIARLKIENPGHDPEEGVVMVRDKSDPKK